MQHILARTGITNLRAERAAQRQWPKQYAHRNSPRFLVTRSSSPVPRHHGSRVFLLCPEVKLVALAQPEMRQQLPRSGELVTLPSAAEVVTNHLRAIGGTAALSKLESQSATGTSGFTSTVHFKG